jgi:hypothetical protein
MIPPFYTNFNKEIYKNERKARAPKGSTGFFVIRLNPQWSQFPYMRERQVQALYHVN